MLTYRLVGVKDESSNGKDHLRTERWTRLTCSIHVFHRSAVIRTNHRHFPNLECRHSTGQGISSGTSDSSGSETWRQFFFSTLERTATRLDIYEDAKKARDDMMMRSMCVKMIMRAPEPMMFPLDAPSLSKSPSEERRGKVQTAAAKCRKVLSLKGDVSCVRCLLARERMFTKSYATINTFK